ncbi:hypothetical protein GGI12_001294 [Dipsacomyces acuminosporus]|nr:hypothetical protein GGI12_001294 [Dipsacomyces acuminosporus]
MSIRKALHADSWYSAEGSQLGEQLQGWLDGVPEVVDEIGSSSDSVEMPVKGARAIIGPHAGYSYSGPNAAYAYKCVDVANVKRVFLLGPSHHVYLQHCALSACAEYETPLGSIHIDQEITAKLRKTGEFSMMSQSTDEEEHSLEMHLPYIYKIFERRIDDIKLVPILVGNLGYAKEQQYGRMLAPYLNSKENLFVISSDFCHWGSRFRFTYYKDSGSSPVLNLGSRNARPKGTPIWQSIKRLDEAGMAAIASVDHKGFKEYLEETDNTICGRHPIGVLLAAVSELYPDGQEGPRLRFVKYDQSSKVLDPRDSSVSYASAYLYLPH